MHQERLETGSLLWRRWKRSSRKVLLRSIAHGHVLSQESPVTGAAGRRLLTKSKKSKSKSKRKSKKKSRPTPRPTARPRVGPTRSCPNGDLTKWYDIDNARGTGDHETLSNFKRKGINICDGAKPIGIECRDVYTKQDFYEFGFEKGTYIDYYCDADRGFLCLDNDDHRYSACPDFEVRFCCPDEPEPAPEPPLQCAGKLTPWYDRDNERGTGDWETISFFKKDHINICDGNVPLDIQCRDVRTKIGFDDYGFDQGRYIDYYCDPTRGFLCRNNDDRHYDECPDFEVQFCCPPEDKPEPEPEPGCPGKVTKWLDRDDPSVTGDWETLGGFKHDGINICNGKKPLDIECRDRYSKIDFEDYGFENGRYIDYYCDPNRGFLCKDDDNNHYDECPDFEVRFCCPDDDAPVPTPRPTRKPTRALPTPRPTRGDSDCKTDIYLGRIWKRDNGKDSYEYSGFYHYVAQSNGKRAFWRRDDHAFVITLEQMKDGKYYLVIGDQYDTSGKSKIYYYLDSSEWNDYANPRTTHPSYDSEEWFCLESNDNNNSKGKGKKSKKSSGSDSCEVITGLFDMIDCNGDDAAFCNWNKKVSYFPDFLTCQFRK